MREHCLAVTSLHFPASVEDEFYPELVNVAAALPEIRDANLGTVDTDATASRIDAFLATSLPSCTIVLSLNGNFYGHEDEAEGAPWRAAIAASLVRCNWRHITLSVSDDDNDLSPVERATVFRTFLDSISSAQSVRIFCLSESSTLGADEARWVTRAIPAHMRLEGLGVACVSQEAMHLAEAFSDTAVSSGTLSLIGPWNPNAMQAALAALVACAHARLTVQVGGAAGEDDNAAWSAETVGQLASSLPLISNLTSLRLMQQKVVMLPSLLSVLPPSLTELRLSSGVMTPASLQLLCSWLASGKNDSLTLLTLHCADAADGARCIVDALRAFPRPKLEVEYTTPQQIAEQIACLVAFVSSLSACRCTGDPAHQLVTIISASYLAGTTGDIIDAICDAGAVAAVVDVFRRARSGCNAWVEVEQAASLLCALHPRDRPLPDTFRTEPFVRDLLCVVLQAAAGQESYQSELLHRILLAVSASGQLCLSHDVLRRVMDESSWQICLQGSHGDTTVHLYNFMSLMLSAKALGVGGTAFDAVKRSWNSVRGVAAIVKACRLLLSTAAVAVEPGLRQSHKLPKLLFADVAAYSELAFAAAPELLIGDDNVREALMDLLNDGRSSGSMIRTPAGFLASTEFLESVQRICDDEVFEQPLTIATELHEDLVRAGAPLDSCSFPARQLDCHEHLLAPVTDHEQWHQMAPRHGPARGDECAAFALPFDVPRPCAVFRCVMGCEFECCPACGK